MDGFKNEKRSDRKGNGIELLEVKRGLVTSETWVCRGPKFCWNLGNI